MQAVIDPGRDGKVPLALSGPISILFLVIVVAGVGAALYLDAVVPASVARGAAASQLAGRPLLVTILVFAGVGFLIVRRQGRNAVGWILLGAAASLSITEGFAGYTTNAAYSPAGTYPLPGLVSLVGNPTFAIAAWLTIGLLPLLFPDGRLLSRRWVWVVRLGVADLLVWQVTRAFDPASTAPVPNPIGIPAAAGVLSTVGELAVAALLATIVPGIASVALRYRRGNTETRLQLRWFLAACVVMLVVTLVPILRLPDIATNSAMAGGYSLAPIAIGLAVARYRLYEIDVVINRALVYGTLAAFITAVYVAIVVGFGSLVGSNGRPNIGLSIIATALVAVAFQPVRERVQAVANRLVYGTRATPYQVLSQFSARVAETYAGADVLPRMAHVLAEGTGAERAEVWLRSGNILRADASWPVSASGHHGRLELTGQLLPAIPEADRAVPVRHQGELLGALSVKKRTGEALTPVEEKLLDDLANQAGLVLKNVGLGRYPQEVEAAVYFCCLEALQNIQKYTSAGRATVRLTQANTELRFEVEDDGIGFDPAVAKRGSGLTNMSDRLEALGGSLRLNAAPGRGSLVAGRLPVPAARGAAAGIAVVKAV